MNSISNWFSEVKKTLDAPVQSPTHYLGTIEIIHPSDYNPNWWKEIVAAIKQDNTDKK